ncbi:MAG: outer membrane protein assembly factor BamA, partial [Deltaproteobacteria bacterium]|nr:outer membrane protein assembly factor BamA [Deltaproteobacteria bacterium]
MIVVVCVVAGRAHADSEIVPTLPSAVIERIDVKGTQRVDAEAIKHQLTSKPGHLFDPVKLRADLHAVWGLRMFADVRATTDHTASGGTILTFEVTERPTIRKVLVAGNHEVKLDKINDVLDLRRDTVADYAAIRKNRDTIAQLYQDQGFMLSTVESDIVAVGQGEVDVRYTVHEHAKVRVRDIEFTGNRAVSGDDLRGAMGTRTPGALSFFDGSGVYRRDTLERDISILTALYLDRGYATVKINAPAERLSKDKKFMHVSISIDEGAQFTFGTIDIKGDVLEDHHATGVAAGGHPAAGGRALIASRTGAVFSRTRVEQDRKALETHYQDRGYANVNVVPRMRLDLAAHKVVLAFEVVRGKRVYVERVIIRGNSKTRDKVIRRELKIGEGELFSGSNIEKSRRRITALGFFEAVTVSTSRGSSDEFVDINVEVRERRTGQFQVGAGFSSLESFIVQGQVAHENFLGRGHSLAVSAQISSLRRIFSFRFIEPRFLDTQWMFSTELYNQSRGFGAFSRNSTGGALTWGRRLSDHASASITYRLEHVDISSGSGGIANLGARSTTLPTVNTANLLRGGLNSSIRGAMGWDTRNNRLLPTDGWNASLYAEYAGRLTASENEFMRWGGFVRNYQRIADSPFVLRLNGEIGVTTSLDGKGVPLSERYLLGGIYDIRGYQARSIGPQLFAQRPGDVGQSLDPLPLGGNVQVIGNAEIEFPIAKRLGLSGVAFFDIGNAYNLESRFCNSSTSTVDACTP